MLRVLSIVLLVLALFFMSFDSPKVGEEERRIWTPVVLGLAGLVLMLRVPLLLKVDTRVLLSAPVLWFVAYLLWISLGQFWSIDPAEGRNHIVMLWVVLLAVLSLTDERPSVTAWVYVATMTLVIVASWLAMAAGWPGVAAPGAVWRFKGIIRHEQTMAFCCIAAFLCAVVWALNRRRVGMPVPVPLLLLVLALAAGTMLAAKARSFTAFFVLTLFAVAFFHLPRRKRFVVAVAGVLVGGGLYLAMDVLLPLLSRGEAQDQTLSGRLIVWELTLQEFWKRPWTGFGFASYQDYFFRFWGDWAPGHAHNSWLHVAFENGIPAAVLLTGLTLALLRRGYVFWRDTGLLSYTLALALFCTLADLMSVVLGGKMTTLYGLVLVLFVQEEHLRALVVAQRRMPPAPLPLRPPPLGQLTPAAA